MISPPAVFSTVSPSAISSIIKLKPVSKRCARRRTGKSHRRGHGEKSYMAQKISQKFRKNLKTALAMRKSLCYNMKKLITFPKASGKAGYIGKLPSGGFSKGYELELANRLRHTDGNIV